MKSLNISAPLDFIKRLSQLTILNMALLTVSHAADLAISANPLFLPTPLAPNIVVTLDDSSSMIEAFAPELCGATWNGNTTTNCTCQNHASTYGAASSYSILTGGSTYEGVAWCDASHVGENILSSRRYKSSSFNPLYYNPNSTYPLPVDASGNTLTAPTFTAAYHNGFASSQGTLNLSTSYRPSILVWEYPSYTSHVVADHPSADFSPVNTGTAAYYYKYDSTLAGCATQTTATTNDDNCYTRVTVSATSGPGSTDERQNFANWYSFYRSRNLMTISGATLAFANLSPTIRLAWQALNSCNTFGTSCSGWGAPASNLDNRIKPFTSGHKTDFYNWLTRLPTGYNNNFNTPLRSALKKAGQYFETSGVNSPYAQDPTVSVGTEYTCRPNFHILMTDGVWNYGTSNADDNTNVPLYNTIGNYDDASHSLPDGKTFSASPPYQDNNTSSLADVALYYWARDLRTDLADNLPPYTTDRTGNTTAQYSNAKNDPANWQHMVNFTVGLGLGSFLTNPVWAGDTYSGGYANFLAGTSAWPATGADVVPGNVYDLWHTALNSRGQFYSADSPQALTNALVATLDRITERQSAAAALATNSTRLGTNTVVYQAKFDSLDWSGQLIAYPVNSDGSIGTQIWDSSTLIPAHASRQIFSWSGSAGIAFDWPSLKTAGLASVIDNANIAASSSPILDYLRGDQTNESPNGLGYRARARRLGDIINSDPAFVGAQDYGYDTLPAGEPEQSALTPYASYTANNASRTKMIYVGANDGMLHAFNAITGVEVFSYVPKSIINSNLATLKDPNYSHKYFVDGTPFVGDAYINGVWKTILIGTTGAGGKGIFALDVTSPNTFGASNVLWEFTDSELGNTIGQPVIARMKTGQWAVVFGNGYNSTSHTAQLFIVNIADGTLIKKLDTGVGTSTNPNQNGLATPTLYDSDGDKIIDYIYAGDLQGNVWKFDVTSNQANNWDIAYKSGQTPKPLFTACRGGNNDADCTDSGEQIQPITGPLEIGAPPTGKSGVMVYFGTGRFFVTGDNSDYVSNPSSSIQSLYGILDAGGQNGNITELDRSVLQQQSILFEGADTGRTDDVATANVNEARSAAAQDIRVTSQNTVNYNSKDGWYMDLLPPSGTAQGERVTSTPLLRHGRVIFTTLLPSQDPCAFGGTSWLMELDATTGARLTYSVFDLNQNGQFDAVDYVVVTIAGNTITVPVTGLRSKVGIIKTPTVISAGATEYKLASGTTGAVSSTSEKGSTSVTGRASWRELINE